MIAQGTFAARLRLTPPPGGGLIELFDHFIRLLGAEGSTVECLDGRCSRTPGDGVGGPEELPLTRKTFRPLLARVAFLCNEHRPDSVSPYGGAGELRLAGPPALLLRVSFTNTLDLQRLEIRPAATD